MLTKFQGETRTLILGIGLEAICVTLQKQTNKNHPTVFCPCPRNLNETEFRSNGLIYFVEEISRQY